MTAEQQHKLQVNTKAERIIPDWELHHLQQYQSNLWHHLNDAVVLIDHHMHVSPAITDTRTAIVVAGRNMESS
jgi:hypothetical protein